MTVHFRALPYVPYSGVPEEPLELDAHHQWQSLSRAWSTFDASITEQLFRSRVPKIVLGAWRDPNLGGDVMLRILLRCGRVWA